MPTEDEIVQEVQTFLSSTFGVNKDLLVPSAALEEVIEDNRKLKCEGFGVG